MWKVKSSNLIFIAYLLYEVFYYISSIPLWYVIVTHQTCLTLQCYYFLLYKKKKVLVSCKFLISGFWWFYTFWDVLSTIWLFLKNVCLCVCVSVCRINNLFTGSLKMIQIHYSLRTEFLISTFLCMKWKCCGRRRASS